MNMTTSYKRRSTGRLLAIVGTVVVAGCAVNHPIPAGFEELAQQSLPQVGGSLVVPGLTDEVAVLRDEWGIPHIYAQNQDDLYLAQGYVQAQDRLWQIDMWRRVNEGRLAEILGPEAFEHDKLARLIMFRGPWEEEWTSYHPNGEQIFQRFAAGVNAYIDEIGDDLPVNYQLTGLRPLRWTPEASVGRVATALPLGNARAELRLVSQIQELGLEEVNRRGRRDFDNWIDITLPEGIDISIIGEEVSEALGHFRGGFPRPPLLPKFAEWNDAYLSENMGAQENSPGSNNWVVSGELTASGDVLLANDPHRGVSNPALRYLVHLDTPEFSVIGATEPAIPGVMIGHNGRIGWGLTIVGTDQADIFVEQLNPDNLDEALWSGDWYPLEIIVDTIPVRGEASRIVQHKYSRHGPVFHVDSINHVAYAVRSTANEPGTGGYLGALRLAEARSCHDFVDAMAYYFAPSENMLCGDVEGNIAWVAAALTPRRSGGWYGRIPVPGTGQYAWEGFRSHTELPQEFNPSRGWIGTANHDIQPPGYYPPIMFRQSPSARWDRLQEMFAGATDLTVEDFEQMQHDAKYPWIDQDRPLFDSWRSDDAGVERARAMLVDWDGIYHRDSPAAALHNAWRQRLDQEARLEETSEARRNQLSEAALAAAVRHLEETLGPDRSQWRWGRIHRSEFPHWLVAAYDLPAVERSGGGGTIAATGATFREIIDFSDFDNSRATSAPGQSMHPGSPFYGNLLSSWGEEIYFPLLYTRDAVESQAAKRLQLVPAN